MLLRQTTARQVAEVWPKLVRRYPGPAALANADPAAVEAIVQPLGLGRQRAAALQAAARHLLEHYGGAVPAQLGALEQVPHVGPYAANAVRSFAFGIPVPIVDTNVVRIFTRYFGRSTSTKNPHREDWIWRYAYKGLPSAQTTAFNYALIDLAHQVCRLHRPCCQACPLRSGCCYRKDSEERR